MFDHLRPATIAAAAAFALLGGCATLSESPLQQLELHTILDHREVAGVGCLLSNDMGRWYVIAPGRVTVMRSSKPLTVSCKKEGKGSAAEVVQSRADTTSLMGNVVISAGLGYFVDKHSGAGYAYPQVLTVLMQPAAAKDEEAGERPVEAGIF
ncbi:hypothetical protein [Massilia sp. AB1]|uniref:hypothetical protein n=1 Tax=Massilia sp. AB1 TaxID=2823371 RepID=UPI001B830C33|nr:hypothetical protein [Massilia sp. AB1]MBQ5942179.1 hypothetical protein [Massilia sp. AB1]